MIMNDNDKALVKQLIDTMKHSVGYITDLAKFTGDYNETIMMLEGVRTFIGNKLNEIAREEVKQNDRRLGLHVPS
jgi:hypothetical protein